MQQKELFGKLNYQLMIAGVVIIFIGLLLMQFDSKTHDDQFGFQATTLAPAVILVGFAVEFFAIMIRRKKADHQEPSN